MVPDGAKILIFLYLVAVTKMYRVKNVSNSNYFAPAGSLRRTSVIFPDIRKVEEQICVMFDSQNHDFL